MSALRRGPGVVRPLLALAAAALLHGCGGLSDVGSQPTAAPEAVATVVGYATGSPGGNVTVDVRAHSEVALTGKESIDADKPILAYLWEAQNDAARSVPVTVRNQHTINLSIPPFARDTELSYRLTVRDSDGDTGSATVTLRVRPALDAQRFLTFIGREAKVRIVAATRQPVASGGAFELTVRPRLTYTTRDRTRNTVDLPQLAALGGSWSAASGSGGDAPDDYRNPAYDVALPAVDADAITRMFQASLPGSRGLLLDPAFIDDAELELWITLEASALQSQGVLYALDANGDVVARAENAGNGLPTELRLSAADVDALRISGGGLENAVTARAYYDAIDPAGEKTTLRAWLVANCFDPAAPDYGADAHAVYTNNYDLGFGRDMYFKTTRPAGCASPSFRPGDSASVVLNYPTLEAAGKRIGSFLVVAMEYKAPATAGQTGLVTFYVFAPDDRTGEFRRVLSANFDGRGEKYLPGACNACHGGRPATPALDPAATYASSADTGATFLPWDLESFLFSDTDPAFPRDASNAALRSRLTRAAQEAEFKKLNLAAYRTYGDGQPFQCHPLYAGPCELVELWYGGPGLPSATFRDGQVAPGWRRGGPDANPESAERLYLDVYARNCRACHTQRVFAAGSSVDPQFRTYADFVRQTDPAWRDRIVRQVFESGGMPAARLTMDRFWLRGSAAASAAELLAQHFGLPAATRPGAPIACVSSEGSPALSQSAAQRTSVARHSVLTLSAGCSDFAGSFAWTLSRPAGSQSALIGADGARASFSPDRPGDYDVHLQITGPDGTSQASRTLYATVPNLLPQAAAPIGATLGLGSSITIDVLAQATSLGDDPVTIDPPVLTGGSGLTAFVDAQSRIVVSATGVEGGTLRYGLVDVDGDASYGTIAVTVTANIAANDATPPAVTAYGSQATRPTYEIPLLPLVAAQGQPVTLSIASPPVLAGRRDGNVGTVGVGPCSADPSAVCALYSPPRGAVSFFGATRVGPDDSFVYRACFTLQPATCDTGTITMRLAGQHAFAPVAATIASTCSGACHDTDQTALGSVWQVAAGSTEKQAWCAIRFRRGIEPVPQDLEPTAIGRPLVHVRQPAASLLYVKPQGGNSHGGGAPLGPADASLAAILAWIEEGGYFTGGTDQTCPPAFTSQLPVPP